MTFMKMRGTRAILSVDVTTDGFAWHLACGHTLARKQRPNGGQKSAICMPCRRTTASFSEPQRDAAATKRVRNKRVAAGLCRDCSAPAEPGRKQCRKHLAANAAGTKRQKAARAGSARRDGEASR